MKSRHFIAAMAALVLSSVAHAGTAGWTEYVIRGGATATDLGAGQGYEFVTANPGDKAALGTNLINGYKISEISMLAIVRTDNNVSGGSVWAPYMNIWVEDINGKHAVLANEPSNPEWPGDSEHNTTGSNLLTKTVKVFESEAGFQLPGGFVQGVSTFSLFGNYVIDAPSPVTWGGTGAPKRLSDGATWGFNWVFGDTLSNYVSGTNPGYLVQGPVASAASAVPLPTSALAGMTLLGAMSFRRRR